MPIKFVPYQELNFSKWDRCINTSYNSEIYAYSWFLNSVIEQWDAVIEGDYQKVMPLPVRNFMGKPIIYAPLMAPQLGIFSQDPVCKETVKKFIDLIFRKNKFAKLPFNKFFGTDYSFARVIPEQSFDLDLITPYKKTVSNYSNEAKRKIRFAEDSGLFISKGFVPNEMPDFHRTIKIPFLYSIDNSFYNKLRRLISLSIQNRTGETFGVYTHENNLCSLGFIIKIKNRVVIYLIATDYTGVKKNSTWLLIDHIIRLYSERNVTLRFEPFNFHRIGNYPKISLNFNKKNICDQHEIFISFGAKKYTYPILHNKVIPWVF